MALERKSFTTPWSEAQFLQELALPLSTILVIRQGEGEILGYLVYWLICDEVHLQDIAVRPEDRRRGIASRLLATALRKARLQGARRATLEVRESNRPAQGLYKTIGFILAGRRKGYYSDCQEDALIYWANLFFDTDDTNLVKERNGKET